MQRTGRRRSTGGTGDLFGCFTVTERAEHCLAGRGRRQKERPACAASLSQGPSLNRRTSLYLTILLALLALPGTVRAEMAFETGLTLSEEYNDNVYLAPDNERTDYITRVVPAFHFVYTAPVWEWDLAYAYDFRYYAHQSKKDDSTHDLRLTNHTSLIRNFLFLDVRDTFRRVSLDTTRDFTQQSLFFNQTDENEFIVTPYVKFDLTSHTTGTAGYEYRNVWYRQRGAINKDEHTLSADFVDQLSLRTSLHGGARFTRIDSEAVTYNKTDIYAGPRYEYADGSFLWVFLGNSWFDSNKWESVSQGSWDAGLTHLFRTYTLSLAAALTYIDDPRRVQRREDRYTATFTKATERSAISATAGRWEYRNILTKRLENTRHGVGGSVSHEFTGAFTATYFLNIDRYEDNRMRTYSMLYLNTFRAEYLFPASTTLALEYRFNHGYSPDEYTDNYDNNRIVLEIRTLF